MDVEKAKAEAEWFDMVRLAAQKQTVANERMEEIGKGVGGLGVQNPEMFEDMLTWDNMTINGHADTVLALVAEVERLRAEIVAVHGAIDDLYERLYEAAHCGSARECQLMVLAILDKDGETDE